MTIINSHEPITDIEMMFSPDGSTESALWVPFSSILDIGIPIVGGDGEEGAENEGDDMTFMGRCRVVMPDGTKLEFTYEENEDEDE